MTEEEKRELIKSVVDEMQPKPNIWTRLSNWKKALGIITGLVLALAMVCQGVLWFAALVWHEEIQQWEHVIHTVNEFESTTGEIKNIRDTIKVKEEEFNTAIFDLHDRMDEKDREGARYHAVGLRADSSCNLYYRDKCGDLYKVYPDLEYSTAQMTYWYYIEKRTHQKRYIFNERYD